MKKFISILLSASIMTASCMAINDNTTFADISTNNWYYTDIVELQNSGYVYGYDDNMFMPDKEITLNELVLIMSRQSKFEDYIHSTALKFAEQQGWLESNYKADEPVTREQALHIILASTGISSWTECDLQFSDTSDIADEYIVDFCAGVGLGIICGYNDMLHPKEHITRAEVCAIFNRALKCGCDIYAPEELRELGIEYAERDTSWLSWNYRQAIKDIPNELLCKFINDKWKIIFTNNIGKYYPEYSYASGITSYSDKTIYIRTSGSYWLSNETTIYHEFGHFLMSTMDEDFKIRAEEVKELEQNTLAKGVGRSYCKTNVREYFAEAFKYYIISGYDIQDKELSKTESLVEYALESVFCSYK